jgi:hypothetical protein
LFMIVIRVLSRLDQKENSMLIKRGEISSLYGGPAFIDYHFSDLADTDIVRLANDADVVCDLTLHSRGLIR